jgi:polyphosphate kinase
MLLEDRITMHVGELFPGYKVLGCSPFRVTAGTSTCRSTRTRPTISEDDPEELRRRERGQRGPPGDRPRHARRGRRVPAPGAAPREDDVYLSTGPLHLADLRPLRGATSCASFRDEPFSPQIVPPLQEYDDIFRVIAQRDILLQHPYESFEDVVEFISEAADDPERAGDQADAVPHQRRLAHRARADPRRRERQAGHRRSSS